MKSKPINRRQFVLGKYIGILQSVLLLLLPLAFVLMACIYVKVAYDAQEGGAEIPAAESLAIFATSAVSSRPGKGTCDANDVDSISAMSSEVIGCTTERSACGSTTEETMVIGPMPRLRAACTWPTATVLMPVRR